MMQRMIGGSGRASSVVVLRKIPAVGRGGWNRKSCSRSNCTSQSSRLHQVQHSHQPQHQQQYYQQQVRGKKTSSKSSKNDKLRSINRTLEAQNEKMKVNHSQSNSNSNEYIFGLKPVDVTILPPLFRPPPPPPPKPGMQRLVLPFTLIAFAGTGAYFYFNNKNDAHEYWDAMQTGGVAPGTYDDDDDDDDEEDFDDDVEE